MVGASSWFCCRGASGRLAPVEEQPGICPLCEEQGAVGAACTHTICAKRDHAFIPTDSWAHASRRGPGTVDPMVGRLIDDYLIVDVLGAGGVGKVYLSLQQPIGLKAALKVITFQSADAALAAAVVEKFTGEARALATLSHPNIVRLCARRLRGGLQARDRRGVYGRGRDALRRPLGREEGRRSGGPALRAGLRPRPRARLRKEGRSAVEQRPQLRSPGRARPAPRARPRRRA